jgi:glycosyltransferase involved in cell wall biosynthesis
VILPLLSGGGVKVKLLEAMGYGKIIISTAKGIEGTDFENNKHILLAENAKDFAELCIKVLENNQSYQYIADNGYKEIVDNYSWSAIMDKFNLRLMEEQ